MAKTLKYIDVNIYYRRLWDKMFGTETAKELEGTKIAKVNDGKQ